MELYNNAGGTPMTGAEKGELIGMGLTLVVGTLVGISDAKKQRQLQEKLGKLSLKQAKELESKMIEARSQTERLSIIYQTFAVLENQNLINDRKNKQLTLLSFMGGGILLLVGMAIVFKRKR